MPRSSSQSHISDNDTDPALGAHGDTLLFSSDRNGGSDVFLCNLATGACQEPTNVNSVADETRPRFLGPGGTSIAWVSSRKGTERAYARPLEVSP